MEPAFLGGHDLGSRQPLVTTSTEVQQHLQDSAAAAASSANSCSKENNGRRGGGGRSSNSSSSSASNTALSLPPLTPQGRHPLSNSAKANTPGRKGSSSRSGFTANVQATRSPMRTPHPPSVSVNITPHHRSSDQGVTGGPLSGAASQQSGNRSSNSLAPPRTNRSLAKAMVLIKVVPYVNEAASALASDLRISSSGADIRTPVRLKPRAADFEKQRLYATSR